MTTATRQSPSYVRRQALRDADKSSIITVLNSYSIEKYYDAADRLLETFQHAIDRRNLDDAYILGVRFGTFSLESLPKHKDYSKVTYKSLRIRNAKQVEEVLQKVERVTKRMDAEEKIKAHKKIQEEEKQKKEQEEKRRMDEHDQLMAEEKKREKLEKNKKEKQANLERSARLKLAALMKTSPKQERKKRIAPNELLVDEKKISINKGNKVEGKVNNPKRTAQASTAVARERDRVAKEAKKLYQMQEEQLAYEEGETLKLLHREVEEDFKRQAKEDEALVTTVIEASKGEECQESKVSPETQYTPIGMRTDEKNTIKLLRETVIKQERRLKITEEIKIPKLIKKAKQKLAQGERKPALFCVARKRRLEKDAESLKDAIFNMETQILFLESAVEDREIAEAMKAAADTLEAMHTGIQDNGIDDLTQTINEVSKTMEHDIMLDEEDLLSELQESKSCSEDINDIIPGGESILSLPSAPSTEMPEKKSVENQRKPLLANWF